MELAADAVDGLPEWVHDAMDNVEIFVEDLPPPDEPGLLGLYHGVPLSKRGDALRRRAARSHHAVPPSDRTDRAAGSDDRLRRVIAHTVAHEVAHHFGISDDRLREIGAY